VFNVHLNVIQIEPIKAILAMRLEIILSKRKAKTSLGHVNLSVTT
jgi:hypothetical protein